MKTFLQTIAGMLVMLSGLALWGTAIIGWGYGVHHAFSKHHWFAGVGSIAFFPAGYYFAIESFWHEEEWEEVYEDYSQVFAHLVFLNANQTFSESDKSDLIIQRGNIQKWIKLMPEEEKKRLKDSGRAVIEFVAEQNRDIVQILAKGEKFESSKFVDRQIDVVKNDLPNLQNEHMRQYLLEGLQQVVPDQLFKGLDSIVNKASGKSSDSIEMQRFLLSSIQAREKNAYTYLDTFFN